MNKFKQVSSDDHQMSVAGGGRVSRGQGIPGGGRVFHLARRGAGYTGGGGVRVSRLSRWWYPYHGTYFMMHELMSHTLTPPLPSTDTRL